MQTHVKTTGTRAGAVAVSVLLALALAVPALAGTPAGRDDDAPMGPVLDQGRKWRLAYYQGGLYNDYVPVLKSIVEHLEGLGWLQGADAPCVRESLDTRDIWQCLEQEVKSPYLEFVQDAFWSADWDEDKRRRVRAEAVQRLRTGDVDLVLAMGTWAGQDLAVPDHAVPTVVCSTSNALASGIIQSPEDSGLDHVHARVDPTRYARQVELFHDIVGFQRLGVVLEDTLEGRSYAGMDQIEPVAERLGFNLVECHAPFAEVEQAVAEDLVAACYEHLAPRVDAVYISLHRGVTPGNMVRITRPLLEHRVPSFAMGRAFEVRYGVLMSMAQTGFDYAGAFYAQTMGKIFNGAVPRRLTQVLPDPQWVSINLETAKRIGVDFPLEVLGGAKTIYEEIEVPEQPRRIFEAQEEDE